MTLPLGLAAVHVLTKLDTDAPELADARAAADSDEPIVALAGAIALVRLRRLGKAARVARAVGRATNSVPLRLIAARVLFVCRRHQQGLSILRDAKVSPDDAAPHPAAVQLASTLSRRLGWYNDAYAPFADNGPTGTLEPQDHARAAATAAAAARLDLALAHTEARLNTDSAPANALFSAASLAVARYQEAARTQAPETANARECAARFLRAAARARANARPTKPLQFGSAELAQLWLQLGEFEAAEQTVSQEPESVACQCLLGSWALWRGDGGSAEAHLRAARERLTGAGTPAATLNVLALALAVGLCRGDARAALSAVESAQERGLDLSAASPEFWAAYYDALRACDRPDEATAALKLAPANHPAIALRRACARLEQGRPLGELADQILPTIRAVEDGQASPAADIVARGALMREGEAAQHAVQRTLSLLGFNYSDTPTTVSDGAVRLLQVADASTPPALARTLQGLLLGDPSDTIAALVRARDQGEVGGPGRVALGEAYLWTGDYAAAESEFLAATSEGELSPRAHAHAVILAARARHLLGDTAEALRRLNAAEPAIKLGLHDDAVRSDLAAERDLLRGEIRMAKNDLDGAWSMLTRANQAAPGRVATVLLLGLCATRIEARNAEHGIDVNHDDEDARDVHRAWLMNHAPALLSDAAVPLKVAWIGQRDEFPKVTIMEPVLTQALSMLRGCRSDVFCTYWTHKDVLRSVIPADIVHQADGALLTAAATLLHRVARVPAPQPIAYALPQRRPNASAKRQAFAEQRALALIEAIDEADRPSEADVQTFQSQGYLKIEGCVAPEIVEEWRERALAGMLEDPEGSIQKFVAMDGTRFRADSPESFPGDPFEFTGFDPDDPTTWRRARIDIRHERHAFYGAFSPRLWAAIDTFTGGANRLTPGSQKFSEYFILNLALGRNVPLTASATTGYSWHMDAPRTDATLTNIHANLLLLLLFTDVEEDRGPTYIAPESVWKVADALAQSPDGMDFTKDAPGADIAAACKSHVPLTGKAGDVYVLHPFMLHTASINRTGLMRWISNPVLFSETPLDFSGEGKSPVEQMIHSHLST